MKSKVVTVGHRMSLAPHSIGREQPLSLAHSMMRAHGIRHLPVLEAGKLVGILSSRDLYFIETMREVDPNTMKVEEAMTDHPYIVTEDTPLSEVAATMAEHHYGCAVVMSDHRLAGIFTTVDGMRALADSLLGGCNAA